MEDTVAFTSTIVLYDLLQCKITATKPKIVKL